MDGGTRAEQALRASGIAHTITRHGRVGSLEKAAKARGVAAADIVKTLVVRRAEHDHLFVLVPGDRQISWPKLRALLGINRISMPDREVAREVTGYERGTITPFGSRTQLPVIADESIVGRTVSIGAGAHGRGRDPVRRLGDRPSPRPDRRCHGTDLSPSVDARSWGRAHR